jgi:hypothetical protein
MKNIKSIYVDWSAPKLSRGLSFGFKSDWEIALIARSTYYSKEVNGFSPVLYCDPLTESYYYELGILDCFDEVFPILPESPEGYDPGVFWAAGKFEAILHCDSPFILMDLDLEIREKIDLSDCELFCSHVELIDRNSCLFYPEPRELDREGFFEKRGIGFGDKALNTSLLYFKDLNLAKEYSNLAMEYMKSISYVDPNMANNCYILLAEQRLLSEFSRIKGITPKTLISGHYLPSKAVIGEKDPPFIDSNMSEVAKYFLHIWGHKIHLDSDPSIANDLYMRLLYSSPTEIQSVIENAVEYNHSLLQFVQ